LEFLPHRESLEPHSGFRGFPHLKINLQCFRESLPHRESLHSGFRGFPHLKINKIAINSTLGCFNL
jgi:hypothetical protein